MRRLDQQVEAQLFNQKHAMEIAEAEATLFAKAIVLLEEEGRKALQADILCDATDAINREQLHRLCLILRKNASYFCGTVKTDRYWAWIDAAGFLFDATGTQWPYMTQEQRGRRLSWVDCVLQERFQQAEAA